jgi:hypothetical protein
MTAPRRDQIRDLITGRRNKGNAMHKTCRKISIFLYWYCLTSSLFMPVGLIAQSTAAEDDVVTGRSRRSNIGPIEKLMITHDRDLYLEGDTIWLKIINTDLFSGMPIELSSTAYVELLGPGDKILARQKINLIGDEGKGWISIPENILSGNYYLRTYTSWMKNFHPSGYAYTLISIINPFIPLHFAQLETGKNKQGGIDVELYPEGGHLIAGIENRIFFRLSGMITNKDSLLGEIRDEHDSLVTRVKFISSETGYFSITPLETIDYHLSLIIHGTSHERFPLPRAEKEGYAMDCTENLNLFTLKISKHPASSGERQKLRLTGKASGQVLFHGSADLENGTAVVMMDTKLLKDGIHEFLLEDAEGKRLCSRIIHRPVRNQLSLEIKLESRPFLCRDSIHCSINVRDMDGRAVKSDLSASVFLVDALNADEVKDPGKMFVMDPVFFTQWMKRQGNVIAGRDGEYLDVALSAGYSIHSARNPDSIEFAPEVPCYPELAGPSVSGIIFEGTSVRPAGNRLIMCSTVGAASQLQVFKTREDGRFRFALAEDQGYEDLVFRALDQDIPSNIEIDNPYSDQYLHVILPPLHLDESRAPYIKQLSLNQQVREAYKDPDEASATALNPGRTPFFYGEPAETVDLGRFIQLPVMEEIFREIVKSVIVYRKGGALKIGVIDAATREIIGENPLFLLDGVPLFDHGMILEIDPALIGTIHVVDSKYFVGDLEMDGIIDIRTRQGRFQDIDLPASTLPYRFQSYATKEGPRTAFGLLPKEPTGSHLPDFRSLLYWNPDIRTDNEGRAEISFTASDVPGKYRIVVEGISADGYTGISAKEIDILLTDPSGK